MNAASALSALSLAILLSACVTPQQAANQPLPIPPIPPNSATMVKINQGGNLVAQDAYRTLSQYIEAKHQCKEFSIHLVVFGTSGDKDLLIDGQGRLWKGTISEKWHSLACGKERIFTMVISADGKGGNFVAIAE